MATNCDNNDISNDSNNEILLKTTGLSTSFTISFEDDDDNLNSFKQKKIIKTANMFTRRHVRTLSLPVNECSSLKNNSKKLIEKTENKLNSIDKSKKKSESSDMKVSEEINGIDSKFKIGSATKNNFTSRNESVISETFENGCNNDHSITNSENNDCKFSETISDSESEGGTYTLDKDNEQVQVARKSIDQVFGISSSCVSHHNDVSTREKFKNRSRMVDEWIEQLASNVKSTVDELSIPSSLISSSYGKNINRTSKIPSPIVTRRELNSACTVVNSTIVKKPNSLNIEKNQRFFNSHETKIKTLSENSTINDEIETKHYLKETEKLVSTIQSRFQSDEKNTRKQSDVQNVKEPTVNKYSSTRFNRAFSLRRDRLKRGSQSSVTNTAIPVRSKNTVGMNILKTNFHFPNNTNGHSIHGSDKNINSISRGMFNVRRSVPVSLTLSKLTKENGDSLKKKINQNLKNNTNSGIRSNSSLSSQEIEFQNWKRRKNYDPIKAAARDKKKKSTILSATNSHTVSPGLLSIKQQSVNPHTEEDINVEKPIIRSASFHGLHNKSECKRSLSPKENNFNYHTNAHFISSHSDKNINSCEAHETTDEEEWAVPKPPSTSLQNTPPESISSRLSLSNAASGSSMLLFSSPIIAKVDMLTLLNVTQLSDEIKTAVFSLRNTLRCNEENVVETDTLSCSKNQNNFNNEFKKKVNELNDSKGKNSFIESDVEDNNELQEEEKKESSDTDEFYVDHQLNITLKNLEQILTVIQKLQLEFSDRFNE